MRRIIDYSEFVTQIYNAVIDVMPLNSRGLLAFASGGDLENETNETAYLRNEKAIYFYSVLVSNSELFQIDQSNIFLQQSLLFQDEIAIHHSCYAKNLRRWMNGQIPRKRRCRSEFAALAYSWANAFGTNQQNDDKYVLCRERIRVLCQASIDHHALDAFPLLDLIWHASCNAYLSQYSL